MGTTAKPHLPECVCGTLRQVTRAVTQLYDDALRPAGLRAMQFQMLSTVRHLGQVSLTDLAAIMTLDQTTLTRSMAILEKQKWVERKPQTDKRKKSYALTRRGLAKLDKASPLWQQVQQQVIQHVGPGTWTDARAPLASLLELSTDSQETPTR
jgi:DNA-binding MarR family transcriptional regulator